MENGKPVTYLRSEGHILSKGAPANRFYTENGAICWDSRGAPVIIPRPEAGWDSVPNKEILRAGPPLLLDGEPPPINEKSVESREGNESKTRYVDTNDKKK